MNSQRSAGVSPRPRSPHLQITKWPITMATSIVHRVTGIGLAAGTLLLCWWLVAAALGPDVYSAFERAAYTWIGRLVLFGFTWALIFHALNGVRHLAWDLGLGFELKTANATGILTFGLSVILTLVTWIFAYMSMGAL